MMRNRRNLPEPLISLLAAKAKGSILVLVLWSLCLLSTFAVILGYGVRQKIVLAQRLDERDKLHFIAEAGARKAIAELKKDTYNNNSDIFKEINIGDGKAALCLADEESKININTADEVILRRLFRLGLGFDEVTAQDLAACIIDWRDSDSELSLPIGSAEDSYYRSLGYPYEAKDANFEVLDELLLVKDMDTPSFEKIKNYLTIYGDGKININTTSKPVLLALGLNEDIIDKILTFCQGEDGIMGTPDDNIFTTPAEIIPKVSQFSRLSDSEIGQLSAVIEQNLVTESQHFMLRSVAQLNNKKGTLEVVCIVNKKGKILYWRES